MDADSDYAEHPAHRRVVYSASTGTARLRLATLGLKCFRVGWFENEMDLEVTMKMVFQSNRGGKFLERSEDLQQQLTQSVKNAVHGGPLSIKL